METQIITVTSLSTLRNDGTYTIDEWTKRNGGWGLRIIEASKTDALVEFFRESLRNAPYVTSEDSRLTLAYGYFVSSGIMPQEVASAICGIPIAPMSKLEVELALGLPIAEGS